MTAPDPRAVVRPLLAWYDGARRDLPWRRKPSAYRTLVSELMLQQTVVATVIPYFHRFMARFPDVRALAASDEDEVMALWSGLGYYSRARNLHRAARTVVEQHGGDLPADEGALRALPGVGEYTAAAIAAIAFGVRTFALDGNAARVVARLAGVDRPIDQPAVRALLRSVGQALVPKERAGDFAQAVMELGALVCVSGTPRCPRCPLALSCAALATGKTEVIPARTPRAAKRIVRVACVAIERAGRVLLVHRPAGELLGGTWTLPAAEACDDVAAAARRALAPLGLEPDGALEHAGDIRHVFTHRDVTASVYRGRASGRPTGGRTRWTMADSLEGLAVSSFTRKTLALLGARSTAALARRRSPA